MKMILDQIQVEWDAFTPSKLVNKILEKKFIQKIIKKTFNGLKKDKINYRGIIFLV